MRVMIIDDERPARQYIAKLVRDCPIETEIIEERSAVHALESLRENMPDVIFLDITMPQIDGLTALEEIRKLSTDVKVVMLTCHDNFEYARTALKLEALDYVLKDELNIKGVEQLLRRAGENDKKQKDETDSTDQGSPEGSKLISSAVKYISENYMSDISLAVMSKEFYVNSDYFCKKFKKVTGVNFSDYIKQVRLKKAEELLTGTNMTVTEISNSVGFKNDSYFSHIFKKEYGCSPNSFRKNRR